MSGKTAAWFAVGLTVGVLAGKLTGRPAEKERVETVPAPVETVKQDADSAAPTNSQTREQQLLLMAIHELDLTSSELEEARARIQRMERKAKRYDWLRDNGLHGNYAMRIDQETFKPTKELLDFLGLDEEDADTFNRFAEESFDAVRSWETDNAVCTTDNATNCVYEIGPLPDSFKQDYIAQLGSLLHPEDLQLIQPSISDLFDQYSGKREVSATFVSSDDYAELMTRRGTPGGFIESDMINISIHQFSKNGHSRGSRSSWTAISPGHPLLKNPFVQRWSHLFDMKPLLPESEEPATGYSL